MEIVEFLPAENVGLAVKIKALGYLEAEILISIFMVTILKIQDGSYIGIRANGNIDFLNA